MIYMKKLISILIFVIVGVLSLVAQSAVIVTKDSERITVKVYEITDYSVKYKLSGDSESQMLEMYSSQIDVIEFENGIEYKFKNDYQPQSDYNAYDSESQYNNDSSEKSRDRRKKSDYGDYSSSQNYSGFNENCSTMTLDTGTSIMVRPGLQIYKSKGKYIYGSNTLTNKDFSSLLMQTCPEANNALRKWKAFKFAGIGTIVGGVVLAGVGNLVGDITRFIMGGVGAGLIITGAVLCVNAKKHNTAAIDYFNGQCSNNVSASLSLYVSPVGVGMSLDF